MTYDSARGRVVLFGGLGATQGLLADTWEYDGTTWIEVSPATGPSGRRDHVLAYDPVRARVLLFGGAVFAADTWEWDGSAWIQRAPDQAPPDRRGGALAYDARGHQMVLFGGAGVRFLEETYVRSFQLAEQTERCDLAGADTDGDGLAGCVDPDCWARCSPLCTPGTSCMTSPRCGDGTCDPLEDTALCPADCPAP
jgi:hypothetical protein